MIRLAAAMLVAASLAPALAEEPVWRTPNGEMPPASAGLAAAAPAPTGTCTAADWNGDWYSIYGVMKFTVTGASLEGTYEYLNGHIAGALDETGCQLTGRWDQDPSHKNPEDVGAVVFTLSADRKAWLGAWQFDADPTYIGGWDAYRTADALDEASQQ